MHEGIIAVTCDRSLLLLCCNNSGYAPVCICTAALSIIMAMNNFQLLQYIDEVLLYMSACMLLKKPLL